ncbi:MAG: Gfo/Idh/MocA family protein [Oliverpabstia sp.]
MKKVKAALIGAGQRGADAYAPYALSHPEEIEFVAVAEPDPKRREAFRDLFRIPNERCYESWDEFFDSDHEAEAVLICTQDRDHFVPAMKAIEKGYHILLEKPVSFLESECEEIKKAAETYDKVFIICHVLRYTPFFKKLKELLDEKIIGELQNIQWIENVGYWHQAHSYVRGNWRNSEESSPMILAKCCHDMDMILWLADADCTRVSSFGSLGHFKKENAPQGAPERCLDGCPAKDTCPYYAPRIYIDWGDDWQAEVIRKVVSKDTSEEAVMAALKTGPYGRCVYHCDNDVVDHQVVNLEFENGVTASMTMTAFSYECSRVVKFMGSRGEINGKLEDNELEVTDFLTGKREVIPIEASASGHGGGDEGIMKAFVEMIRSGEEIKGATSAVSSLQGHRMAFAAEEARVKGTVVRL